MRRIAVLVAVLALGGCSGSDDPTGSPSPGDRATATSSSSTPPDATASSEPTPSSPTSSPTSSTDPTPSPALALLAWEPVGRPVEEEVTTGGGWTAVVDEERSLVTLSGVRDVTVSGDKRFRVESVLLDEGWAVVVLRDTLQQRPSRATLVDLATGATTVLDGGSDPPTVNGGTWALHGGLLVHATRGRDNGYCLAARNLGTRGPEARGATVYCAPEKHGFTNARISPTEVALMAFDDHRPSCRSLGTVADGDLLPLPEVEACKGWEAVVTEGGPVWAEIPRPNVLDESHVYAGVPDGAVVDLGPATSGSLTWCAGATYFVRDPQSPGEPARLLRWTDAGAFEVVYETPPGGQAFLDGPRCGGDRITLSAYAESGDQQVSAALDPGD